MRLRCSHATRPASLVSALRGLQFLGLEAWGDARLAPHLLLLPPILCAAAVLPTASLVFLSVLLVVWVFSACWL